MCFHCAGDCFSCSCRLPPRQDGHFSGRLDLASALYVRNVNHCCHFIRLGGHWQTRVRMLSLLIMILLLPLLLTMLLLPTVLSPPLPL